MSATLELCLLDQRWKELVNYYRVNGPEERAEVRRIYKRRRELREVMRCK